MKLTLPEAVRLALAQNRILKIARLKVIESEQKKAAAKSSYFPEIKNQSMAGHSTAEGNIEIPAGAFGVIPNAGVVPNRDILINQGNLSFVTSGTTAAQPLTPLIRIRQANRIAASNVAVSRDELKKAENEVALKIHEVYYGILSARLQNLVWGRTRSQLVQFDSTLGFWPLLRLTLKNWLLVLLTLGLYLPFARVATTRLRLEAISVQMLLSPDELVSTLRERADDASGDAAGDLFGFDIGL